MAEECNCQSGGKTILIYSCSGAANVAEVADRACRQLASEGTVSMFCLAGLGADIPAMVQAARDADLNVILDGCQVDCAKRVFDRHGISNYKQIRVTDLGIDKQTGARSDEKQVAITVDKARKAIEEG